MPFRFYRVFCSAPDSMQEECGTFLDCVAQVNEEIIGTGNLLVPVLLPANLTNKPLLQNVVDQNVEDCTFFVQLLQDTWGSPERHTEHEYQLACRCRDDASRPMRALAVFFKAPADAGLRAAVDGSPSHDYTTPEEFRSQLTGQLQEWAGAITAPLTSPAPPAPSESPR
jgi:hypothetical protein